MPGASPFPVDAAIGAAVGLAQTVTGIVNNKKAKKEAKELERSRPKYQVSDLPQKDLDLAESELGGLSSQAETAYGLLQDKAFSSSLGAILRGGGSVNNVGDVYGASDEGRQRLALLNESVRAQKIQNLAQRRAKVIEENDKGFLYNVDAPWKDKARANYHARTQAQQDIWGGLKTAAGVAMQGIASERNWNRYEDLYKDGFGTFDEPSQPSASGTTYYNGAQNDAYGDFENPFEEPQSTPFDTGPSTKPANFPMYR